MDEVLWLGVLLGAGAALSVGPIFVTILNEAATRGLGASLRIILGSAVADLVLLLPALAFASVIAAVADAALVVGLTGAAFLAYLAASAVRDARRLWRRQAPDQPPPGWAFWKGVMANLANPLTWTFWLATGTPTMLRAERAGGWAGLVLFTTTWFAVACGVEAAVAVAAARSSRRIGPRGQGVLTAVSAVLFVVLAGTLLVRDVFPHLAA